MLNYESLIQAARGASSDVTTAVRYYCITCGIEAGSNANLRCASCKGPIDAIYDLDRVSIPTRPTTPNTLAHFGPLLPFNSNSDIGTKCWLGEGNTPCLEVPELAEQLGVGRLFVKDESCNPTRSTKDRIASVGLARFAELGVKEIVMSSTGNSSTAYARGVQLLSGFRAHIFVGRDFLNRLNYLDSPDVVTHVVDGPFVAASSIAQKFAEDNGFTWEGGFFNLARREGLKTAYLEAYDAMPVSPDYVFQAVSSGMGLLGGYKGALEYYGLGRLEHVPGFFAVQQESCAPMARAFSTGAEQITDEHIVKNPSGIAYAILRGNPSATYPYIRDMCLRTGGAIVAAPESAIRLARAMLSCSAVQVCAASATALAGVMTAVRCGQVGSADTVLVNLTGGDRPVLHQPTDVVRWNA